MGIGAGILLIALGAILAFAVHAHVAGIDLHAVGWVLMIVGVLGLVLYFTFWNRRTTRSTGPPVDRTVVTDEATYPDRRVYRQERVPPDVPPTP